MKESKYKDYDELPVFLNARMVADLLGVSQSTAYELMHEKDFPQKDGDGIPSPSIWIRLNYNRIAISERFSSYRRRMPQSSAEQ